LVIVRVHRGRAVLLSPARRHFFLLENPPFLRLITRFSAPPRSSPLYRLVRRAFSASPSRKKSDIPHTLPSGGFSHFSRLRKLGRDDRLSFAIEYPHCLPCKGSSLASSLSPTFSVVLTPHLFTESRFFRQKFPFARSSVLGSGSHLLLRAFIFFFLLSLFFSWTFRS